MSRARVSGAWGCLVALTLGMLSGVPAAADAENSPRERWLHNDEADAEPQRESPWRTTTEGNSRKWGLLGSGVGLVAGVGLALWVKSEADERYELYLDTADPVAARAALDDAERYDRATLIGWGLAQISFVAFVYFLTREGKRTLIPSEGEPLVRPYEDGFQVGFRVAP